MKLLTTGDWQAEFSNLDKCEAVVDETLEICHRHKVKHLVHLGDFKQHYNPVDVRVTNFGVESVQKYRREDIDVHVILGNHDRVGMYTDTQNWLPALASAGAHTYDTASGYIVDESDPNASGRNVKKTWLQFLPFCSSVRKFREYSLKLKKQLKGVKPENALLFFHQDLYGSQYNVMAKSKDSKLKVEDLYPDHYLFCVGGHIEFMQQLRKKWNVWYVGAPFAYDWGAANQRKGYLLIDTEEKTIKPIWSNIPRMYDMSWPNFEESRPKDWTGSLIRVHVPCHRTQDVHHLIQKVEAKYEAKYKGSRVMAVAEFPEEKIKTKIKFASSDKDNVERFVADTIPVELENDEDRIIDYVMHQLHKVLKANRVIQDVKFLRAEAKNVLSFKRVSIDYDSKGLVLVSGINKDWGGRSIGSGKTSLLQLIAIAISGRTFKNQKHNRWARRGSTKQAYVRLATSLGDGKLCKTFRARRPHKLKFKINGKDKSSGMHPGITQETIENTLGITWQSLSNAIYIDQQLVNALLTGTDGERKEILERVQNLERFAKARELVKQDIKSTEEFADSLLATRDVLQNTIKVESAYLDKEAQRELRDTKAHVKRIKEKRDSIKREIREHSEHFDISDLRDRRDKLEDDQRVVQLRSDNCEESWRRLKALGATCTACYQPVDKATVKKQLRIIDKKQSRYVKEIKKLDSKINRLEEAISLVELTEKELRESKERLARYDIEYKNALLEQARLTEDVRKVKRRESKVLDTKRKLRAVKASLRGTRHDLVFLEYCSELLSKYGLPAQLNVQMCPILNKSARFYSTLFTNNEIQVKFDVEEGEFKVNVVNAHGGESTIDQSRGELKMASIITAFALRETAVKCNILILDEPGDGLDDVSASKFGKGLNKLVSRFGTVLLATHNPFIRGSVKADHEWLVVKTNGISRLHTNPKNRAETAYKAA